MLFFTSMGTAQSRDRGQPRRSGPGTGNPDEHRVPWKFLQTDALLHETPITLYWIPTSIAEVEKSRLATSQSLRVAATRCVDLEIIPPEHAGAARTLGAVTVPGAFLVDGKGNVIRRTDDVRGTLVPEQVERMLADELAARDETMYEQMIKAGREARSGNRPAAIGLYEKVWNDRCLFPLAGNEAQRALKDLGVTVTEAPPAPPKVDPYLQTPPTPPKSH